MPKDALSHIIRLTTEDGIFEHCVLAIPDKSEGLSTDDNARALQLALRLGKDELIPIYLKFLVSAHTPEGFHQDLNEDITWKDDGGVEEGYGRAMAALGEAATSAPEQDQRTTATSLFDKEELLAKKAIYPRVIAQIIIGLYYRMKIEKNIYKADMKLLADKLAGLYLDNSDKSWRWYEDVITYDNGRLPLAMFYAYLNLGDEKYLKIAKESLDFLIESSYDNSKKVFSFPGFQGWYKKGGKSALFGQQPIEAGSMVEACVKAFEVTKEKKYLTFAKKAFSWYSGENIINKSLMDPETGGIYDGIEPGGVNPNEGAESVISYLLARISLEGYYSG